MARSPQTPRPASRALSLTSAASVLACVAVALLWARSHQPQGPGAAVSFANVASRSYPAVRIGGGPEQSWFAATRPGRVLFVEQSYRRGVGVRGVDVSHCGVVFVNIDGAGFASGIPLKAPSDRSASVLGFDLLAHERRIPGFASGTMAVLHFTVLAVPFWFLLVCTSILPALWLRRWLVKHRRARSGRCLRCGYDLRGIPKVSQAPEGGRCPECGAVT